MGNVGIFGQIILRQYRQIYPISKTRTFILIIPDNRPDMQTSFDRRLMPYWP